MAPGQDHPPPLPCVLLVQSRWSCHQFHAGWFGIFFHYLNGGGNYTFSPSASPHWDNIWWWIHIASPPLAAALLLSGAGFWWSTLPGIYCACGPSGFPLIMGIACSHYSRWSAARWGSCRCGCSWDSLIWLVTPLTNIVIRPRALGLVSRRHCCLSPLLHGRYWISQCD